MSLVRKAFALISQAGTLLQMPRAHVRNLGTAFDTIASHSYHVATIAYVIAKLEGLSDDDAHRACTMGVFHDLAEARTGDHDFIAKTITPVMNLKRSVINVSMIQVSEVSSDYWMSTSIDSLISPNALRMLICSHRCIIRESCIDSETVSLPSDSMQTSELAFLISTHSQQKISHHRCIRLIAILTVDDEMNL